jgi:hypothetical protein
LLDPSRRRLALWDWVEESPGDLRRLWSSCPRGDWLAWLLVALRADTPRVVRGCCECLRMAEAGVPLALDPPRAFLLAAAAWAEGRGPLAPAHDAASRCALLADDATLPASIRSVARASVSLHHLLCPEVPDTGAPPTELASHALLALWHAAAAISSEVNPGEAPGSPWWVRCHEAALARFADELRASLEVDALGAA